MEIYVKMDEPHETDPDPTSSCMFREDGKYYPVSPITPSPEAELLDTSWKVRRAIRIVAQERSCETIFVPE